MMRRLAVLLGAFFLGASMFGGRFVLAADDSQAGERIHRLKGESLQVGVNLADGTCCELIEKATGFNQVGPSKKPLAPWQITVREGKKKELFSVGKQPPKTETLPDGGLRLIWDEVGPSWSKSFRVEVTIRIDASRTPNTSRWEIAIRKPADAAIENVRFPRLPAIAPRDKEFLALPLRMGEATANPRTALAGPDGRGRRLEWSYPSEMSLQCLAYYGDGGPGLYAACDDPEAHAKRFAVWGDAERQVHFEISHEPEQGAAGTAEYRLPYPVVLGAFRGDWTVAAEWYRDSAAAKAFAAKGRLRRNITPEWAQQTGLWVWNRGRSPGVLPPAVELSKKLNAPVSVLWHWWHHCPYDAGFPEYLPPREGASSFKTALAEAEREGVHAILYMNQRLWCIPTKSWTAENAAPYAVKRADGSMMAEVYNRLTNTQCAPMCLGTEFWRNKYAGLAEAVMGDLKAAGVYMDQACITCACYDANHGHPVGPGRYWIDGFGKLTEDVRRRSPADRQPALAGEFCGEAWMPYLDLMLNLEVSQERFLPGLHRWEAIPFFHAVYHADSIGFGNYASLVHPPYEELWPKDKAPASALKPLDRRFARQFYLEQARTFAWGQQPMLANFFPDQLEQRKEEMDYVVRMVRTRQAGLKYLARGTWLRPPAVRVPECKVEFAHVSIYAPLTSTIKPQPSVLVSAWRAADGDVAVALASIVDEPIRVKVPIDVKAYGVQDRLNIVRIDETGRHLWGTLDPQDPNLIVELPPRGLWLLEFRRGK